MRRAAAALWVVLALVAGPVFADGPEISPRPEPRPAVANAPEAAGVSTVSAPEPSQAPAAVAQFAEGVGVRPMPRPRMVSRVAATHVAALPRMAVPRPLARPAGWARRAATQQSTRLALLATPQAVAPPPPPAETRGAPLSRAAAAAAAIARPTPRADSDGRAGLVRRAALPLPPRAGSVCGLRTIRGAEIAPVRGARAGCGIAEPVRITEVAGVRLSTPATVDCPTAQALHTWIETGAIPAVGKTGGGLAAVQVASHYACRTRNNRPGARISEHGRGRAIDISALVLNNGQRITVLHGWRSPQNGPKLKQMHRAACGPFGTVLGPSSDRFHQDHFHFDTANYRSGPYCR